MGVSALRNNETSENTAFGWRAGCNTLSGGNNVFVGYSAGYYSTGSNNVIIGDTAGSNSTGSNNILIGHSAGISASGNDNVFLGYQTGYNNTGSGNIFIGKWAGWNNYTGSNMLYINNTWSDPPLIGGDFANNRVGINRIPLTYTFEVGGTAWCPAGVWASDIRKKKNIQTLNINGLDVIKKLHPVTYEWKEVVDDGMKGLQMGFIAQELEKVLPTLVITANDSMQSKSIKYMELLPIFVNAIQEQQKQIEELKSTNLIQQNKIEFLESNSKDIEQIKKENVELKAEIDKIKQMLESSAKN